MRYDQARKNLDRHSPTSSPRTWPPAPDRQRGPPKGECVPAKRLSVHSDRVEDAAASCGHKVVRFSWSLSAGALVAFAAGCASAPDDRAAAVWTVAPGQDIDAGTLELTVLVSRLGCNNGVTGEVQEPDVERQDDQLVLHSPSSRVRRPRRPARATKRFPTKSRCWSRLETEA